MTLAERFETWAFQHEQRGIEKGIEKGVEKGVEKGEALLLQRLLVRHFGVLPNEVVAQIGSANKEQIESWFDRALDADSLDDVFRP